MFVSGGKDKVIMADGDHPVMEVSAPTPLDEVEMPAAESSVGGGAHSIL